MIDCEIGYHVSAIEIRRGVLLLQEYPSIVDLPYILLCHVIVEVDGWIGTILKNWLQAQIFVIVNHIPVEIAGVDQSKFYNKKF